MTSAPSIDSLLTPAGWAYASAQPVDTDDPGRFHALFGRNSLIFALQVLPTRSEIAVAAIRVLAGLQGRRDGPEIDEGSWGRDRVASTTRLSGGAGMARQPRSGGGRWDPAVGRCSSMVPLAEDGSQPVAVAALRAPTVRTPTGPQTGVAASMGSALASRGTSPLR